MSTVSVFSKITKNLLNELRVQLPNVVFHEVTNPDNDNIFLNSEIIIADFHVLAPYINKLNKLKWLQGTYAGVDLVLTQIKDTHPTFIITRFVGDIFKRLLTEYVIANIVAHERNYYKIYENRLKQIWSRDGHILYYRCIADLTIGILGLGTIGNKIGNVLHELGGKIIGYGRRPALETSMENAYLRKYYNKSQLPEFLKNCDYIINVLPNTPETTKLLNGNILEKCADKKPVFMNIGRGNIIDDKDLINALHNGWLSAAILDVFNIEPLPKTSPLWKMPQIHITPHVAGVTRAKDVAEQFCINWRLFNENKPIPLTVNLDEGY